MGRGERQADKEMKNGNCILIERWQRVRTKEEDKKREGERRIMFRETEREK